MKTMTIGKKLYVSFGIMTLFILILSGTSIFQLKSVTHSFEELIDSYQPIGEAAEEVR